MRPLKFFALTLLAISYDTGAVSFDCSKAVSQAEQVICADSELGLLDDALAKAFTLAKQRSGAQLALKREQRSWLSERNACTERTCIKAAYEYRLEQLRVASRQMSGTDVVKINEKLLDEIEGYYSIPSTRCSSFEGSEFAPCGDRSQDCLVIRKLDAHSAEVEVSSTQTNLHVCNVKGVANLSGSSLVLLDDPADSGDEPTNGLKLAVTSHILVLSYLKEYKFRPPGCGTRASLNGLKFPRNAKRAIGPECAVLY